MSKATRTMSKDPTKSQNVSMYLTQEAAGGLSAGVVGTGEEWYEKNNEEMLDRQNSLVKTRLVFV